MTVRAAADLADWSTLATAVFAAVAAGASWVAVRQVRQGSLPDLGLEILEGVPSGEIRIHVTNHGGGSARRIRFCVTEGGDATYGFLPSNGVLRPGEDRTLRTPMRGSAEMRAIGFVACQDGHHTRAWSASGEAKSWNLRLPWNAKVSDQAIFRPFFFPTTRIHSN